MSEQKTQWIATAEHTGGQDIGHPCTKGIYPDPTDAWQVEIMALDLALAEREAMSLLKAVVADYRPCDCQRRREPGSNAWWGDICISLWPQTAEAAQIARDQDFDLAINP